MKTLKTCTTALLVSLLATCSTSPSYAKVDLESNTGLSLIKSDVRKYQFISSSYQKLNNDSFILVLSQSVC